MSWRTVSAYDRAGQSGPQNCCTDLISHSNTSWLMRGVSEIPQTRGPIVRAERWTQAPERLQLYPTTPVPRYNSTCSKPNSLAFLTLSRKSQPRASSVASSAKGTTICPATQVRGRHARVVLDSTVSFPSLSSLPPKNLNPAHSFPSLSATPKPNTPMCLDNCNCLLSGLLTSTFVPPVSSPPNHVSSSNESCDAFPELQEQRPKSLPRPERPFRVLASTSLSGLQRPWPLPAPGMCSTPTCSPQLKSFLLQEAFPEFSNETNSYPTLFSLQVLCTSSSKQFYICSGNSLIAIYLMSKFHNSDDHVPSC